MASSGKGSPRGPGLAEASAFALKRASVNLNNFLPLQYRRLDGLLVTAKNSGTHWLRFMLSHAMAVQFALPPPTRSSGDDSAGFVAHPKWKPAHPSLPHIGSTHSIPSTALEWGWLRHAARLPPTVVLVRDIEQAMLSNYVKWQDDYHATLSAFVRGDPTGRRYTADAWWFVRFFNRWGEIARRFPGEVTVLRYEEIAGDPRAAVARAGRTFGLEFTPDALDAAAAVSSREAVAARLDPNFEEVIIPDAARRRAARFSADDRAVLNAILKRHLRHDLGYGYLASRERAMEDVLDAEEALVP